MPLNIATMLKENVCEHVSEVRWETTVYECTVYEYTCTERACHPSAASHAPPPLQRRYLFLRILGIFFRNSEMSSSSFSMSLLVQTRDGGFDTGPVSVKNTR